MDKIIVFFDFDGTITSKDTMIEFLKFYRGKFRFYVGLFLLLPVIFLYLLKIISNEKAKELVLSFFLEGDSKDDFESISRMFSLEIIPKIVKKEAIERIRWHKQNGHKVVVVSASIENWIKPWCDENNLELIATRVEIKDGRLTGRLLTRNCYGEEKVRRIKEIYNLDDYNEVYVYGDSKGDIPMLNLASEGRRFYRCF